MLNRFAVSAAACVLLSATTTPLAFAQPAPPPPPAPGPAPLSTAADDGPPPDNGIVASGDPGVVTTPDGRVLTVKAENETQLPVAPLTTAVSSREYLVGGTFLGTVTGGSAKSSGGTMEVGYQIGCGIELGQIRLIGQVGVSATTSFVAPIPTGVSFPLSGTLEIHPKPGQVTQVPVDKKSYKSAPVRVTLKDTHIKVDGCVGQSFLRSYATLTSSTTDTDDIVAYYGVTKTV